jgi:predicted dehydrogenase/uncharacterized protein (DUF362 family)
VTLGLKVGIVGCGRIATAVHMPSLRKIQGYNIVAACDLNQTQLEEVRKKFGVNETYDDYRHMIAKADIDAVFVCTPPQHHFQVAMDAIEQGKHVLVEKPLATTLKEAYAIKEAYETQCKVTDKSLCLVPAHNFTFTPSFIEVLKLIDNGKIGKIKKIDACITTNLQFYQAKTDFRNQAKSGVLEDLLPHLIYLVQRVGGPLEKVSSIEPQLKAGIISVVNIKTRLQHDVEAELTAKWTGMIPTLKFNLTGENGEIRMDLLRTPYNFTLKKDSQTERTVMQSRLRQYIDVLRFKHPSYTNEHIHFLKCAQGETQPEVSVDDGIELVRGLNEITECFEGRTYTSSPQTDIIVVLHADDSSVEAAVQKSIEMLGGLNFKKDGLVVVKPNVCFPSNLENMVITDPRILEAVLHLAKKLTKNVLVVESDAISGTAEKRLTNTGIMGVIRKCDAEFLNLSKDDIEEHKVVGLTMAIPKTVLRADYLINLPKVKTHTSTVVSVAMKNMFGLIASRKKTQFHKHLPEVLTYLNRTIRQDLIIADGMVGMEGLGPVHGRKVDLGLIISGRNPVSVDAACCHIAGFNPYGVEVLWKAHQQGMGEIDPQKLRFLGEDINNFKGKFSRPTLSKANITQAFKTEVRIRLGR